MTGANRLAPSQTPAPQPLGHRPRSRRRPGPHLALLGAASAWAAYTPVTSLAITHHMPVAILLPIQVTVAAVLLWTVVVLRGYRRVLRLRRIALLAALEPTANVGCFALALTWLQAADGSLLLTSESVIVALLGVLVLHERLRPAAWIGLMLSLPGLWLLSGASTGLHLSPGVLAAFAATTASALYSTATAWVGRTSSPDVITFTAWQFGFGAIWVTTIATGAIIIKPGTITVTASHLAPSTWIAAAAGGLLLAAPSLAYNYAIRHVPIAEAGITLNLIPVLGAAIGVIWLGDVLTVHALVGGAITLVAIFTIQARHTDGAPT
ncbi:DMT family transporter [Nonomuraea sp. NPDC049400]|uniref:DMT family transporter n=1 Tax=Nonomuraea sp. NPDC049400 TaxID=3364352 RepID=UPI0037B2D6BB